MTAALAEQPGTDDPDAIIGATIRALVSAHRADTGLLAGALGISRNSYYNRVNGEKAWHARDVARAAAFFGCSVQDIYDGTVRVTGGVKRVCSSLNQAVVIPFPQVTDGHVGHDPFCSDLAPATVPLLAARHSSESETAA